MCKRTTHLENNRDPAERAKAAEQQIDDHPCLRWRPQYIPLNPTQHTDPFRDDRDFQRSPDRFRNPVPTFELLTQV